MSVTHDTFPFAFLAHSHVWELRRIKPHSPNSESDRSSARRNSWILKAIALLSNQSSRINRASRSGPSAQTGFGRQFPSQRLAIPAWSNQKRRSVPPPIQSVQDTEFNNTQVVQVRSQWSWVRWDKVGSHNPRHVDLRCATLPHRAFQSFKMR